jgi:hypothetical protein
MVTVKIETLCYLDSLVMSFFRDAKGSQKRCKRFQVRRYLDEVAAPDLKEVAGKTVGTQKPGVPVPFRVRAQIASRVDTTIAITPDSGNYNITRVKVLDKRPCLHHPADRDVTWNDVLFVFRRHGLRIIKDLAVPAGQGHPGDPDEDLIHLQGSRG